MAFGDAARTSGFLKSLPLPEPVMKVAMGLLGDGRVAATQRAALFAFVIRVASAAIAYLSQIFLARWMGSFEYGIFVFVWVWVLILGGLTSLGFTVSTNRFVPEYRETGRLALLRGLLRQSRAVTLLASTLVAGVGALGLWLFGDMIANYYILPAYLILICVPLYALEDVQDGIARGYRWMGIALVPPYIMRPLLLLLAMLAAWGLGLEMTAVTAAGAAIFATWVAAVIQTVLLELRVEKDMGKGPREYETGYWFKTSLPVLLSSCFVLMLQNTDVLVLSHLAGPSDVAVYFAALKTIALVTFVHFAFSAAAASSFAEHQARGDREGLQEAVHNSVVWTFWPSLAGAALLLLFGKPLLWMFGSEFVSGYVLMFILAVGFTLRAATGPVEVLLNMLGEQKACAAIMFATVALNIILNIALIPLYGATGAAIATALSLTGSAFAMAFVAWRRLRLNCLIWTPF